MKAKGFFIPDPAARLIASLSSNEAAEVIKGISAYYYSGYCPPCFKSERAAEAFKLVRASIDREAVSFAKK